MPNLQRPQSQPQTHAGPTPRPPSQQAAEEEEEEEEGEEEEEEEEEGEVCKSTQPAFN